jgi:aldehyde:ferredoxin oxidoreductase
MSKGYTGNILRVDLSKKSIDKIHLSDDFYRTYLGGSAFGAYFLANENRVCAQPLGHENIITIAPGVTTGAAISGVSRCCVSALSPETGGIGDSQLGGSIGPAVKRAGYDAIVISGKAEKPSYLMIDGDRAEINDASHLWGKTILQAYDTLISEHGKTKLSILQCGPAGEACVRFACLLGDLHDVAGRNGMGAVFGSKNLRAVVVHGYGKIAFDDETGIKALAKRGIKRIPNFGFPEILKKFGTPGILGVQAESGNLATHNYSRSWHENYKMLDGASFVPKIGAGGTTCFACAVSCRKKVKVDQPYDVSDRLGGPEFETLGLLGSNLGITDPKAVAKANELCNNFGLDTISTGGVAAYFFECLEKGLISAETAGRRRLGFNDPESLFWLIDQIVNRRGIGHILADGLKTAVDRFGDKTAAFAIEIKNKVPAAHMAQVKPSQALMYAVCPIGADHMSSEHDWLLSSQSDLSKSLGILGGGELDCTDLNKVRMTVYSQYYYSMLDTLCLCMFCWGCGNLYSYDDILELIRCTTGWESSFWELIKVGERRVNMQRQINAQRGFSRKDDMLPGRLFEPLPDGPAKGRYVDAKSFSEMVEQYYDLMGWDRHTGNPFPGKLSELGLEWMIT